MTVSEPQRPGWPIGSYVKLLVMLTVAGILLLALGFFPSRRLGGEVALQAMLVGTGISWFACAVAGIPLVGMGQDPTPHIRLLISTGVRVLLVAVLTLVVLLGGLLPLLPLMIWVATSYFFLMFVDTGFAFWRLKSAGEPAGQAAAVAASRQP